MRLLLLDTLMDEAQLNVFWPEGQEANAIFHTRRNILGQTLHAYP